MSIDAALDAKIAELAAVADRIVAAVAADAARPVPLVYTPAEAAVVLGVSAATVRRWVTDGTLPRVAGTDRLLIPRRSVEVLVDDVHRRWGEIGRAHV